ncbi:MAG: VOC family protein, partial [Candidatus Binataceae bacterium]
AEDPMSIHLRQICLVAEKLQPVADDLKSVLGLVVGYIDEGVAEFGLENSLFPVGTNFIEVVAPIRENTAAGRYLKRRAGDGGYMVICQCDSHETQLARRKRAQDLHVRLAWERELEAMHIMQLHPADTGGAFFEIDWDAKSDPQGNWGAAGGLRWQSAKRTGVVKSYRAAELQSPDPAGLASRWSSIAEIPLRKDANGRLEMPLANASIRFVEATDGRGEGLSGIDVVVADRKRLLDAAEKRGCRNSDSQVTIGGTRFHLV